jgi:hypothetical protein
MKNITVSVSDEAYTGARIWAAKNGTSVSAAVHAYLEKLTRTQSSPVIARLLNLIREEARAKDKAAAEAARKAVLQSAPEALAAVFSKTTQNLRDCEPPQQNQ